MLLFPPPAQTGNPDKRWERLSKPLVSCEMMSLYFYFLFCLCSLSGSSLRRRQTVSSTSLATLFSYLLPRFCIIGSRFHKCTGRNNTHTHTRTHTDTHRRWITNSTAFTYSLNVFPHFTLHLVCLSDCFGLFKNKILQWGDCWASLCQI